MFVECKFSENSLKFKSHWSEWLRTIIDTKDYKLYAEPPHSILETYVSAYIEYDGRKSHTFPLQKTSVVFLRRVKTNMPELF